MIIKDIVVRYQELANNAWPSKIHFFVNGWNVRISEGYTQRANSVLPILYFGTNHEEDIVVVEQIYRKMNLPKVIFQIPEYTQPSNLDIILASKGYDQRSKTSVMSAKLKNLLKQRINNVYSYKVSEIDQQGQWFNFKESYSLSKNKMHLKRMIINRIEIPAKYFFYLFLNELLIGVALGVCERGYIGVYDVEIHPEFRRKGVGANLMYYIINWGIDNDFSDVYLQVETQNDAGQRLYKKLGFQTLFHYHYREKFL
ncbi:MAG: GNAT family N-acetyltransferase [Promethearchaeota archaeon]